MKEERAIILDFLPHGYPFEKRRMAIAQAVGLQHFTLLELVPKRNVTLQLKEEVYIGQDKRDKIYFIKGRLPKEKLTETAKIQLKDFVEKVVSEQESRFVEFFNTCDAINKRVHQLELLPGFGKKFTEMVIKEREKKPFTSFQEMKQRLKNIPDPKKAIEKRLFEELTQEVRHPLFTG